MMKTREAAMRTRTLKMALALGLVAGVAQADHAVPRGGNGGGSRPAGGNHHSSSGGSSPHVSGGRPSSPPSGYSTAQQRHPRAGTGRGAYYYRPYGYYPGHGYGYGYWPGYWPAYGYGYWPYYGSGLYLGLGFYGGGYYGGGYYGGGYDGGGYDGPAYSNAGALRLLVDPEDTRVLVDGYYAGVVDDFDGMSQRLNLAPGRHEITLQKEGYRSHRIKVYVAEHGTLKIRYTMEKGSGPDTMEDLAGDRGLAEDRSYDRSGPQGSAPEGPAPQPQAPAVEPRPESEPSAGFAYDGSGAPGLLNLSVTPSDASVYVDGRFVGSARQTGELELRPGRHRIEVVRPGYRTAERDLTIESGRTQTLSLDLPRP
jgi:PEGA domain